MVLLDIWQFLALLVGIPVVTIFLLWLISYYRMF